MDEVKRSIQILFRFCFQMFYLLYWN